MHFKADRVDCDTLDVGKDYNKNKHPLAKDAEQDVNKATKCRDV